MNPTKSVCVALAPVCACVLCVHLFVRLVHKNDKTHDQTASFSQHLGGKCGNDGERKRRIAGFWWAFSAVVEDVFFFLVVILVYGYGFVCVGVRLWQRRPEGCPLGLGCFMTQRARQAHCRCTRLNGAWHRIAQKSAKKSSQHTPACPFARSSFRASSSVRSLFRPVYFQVLCMHPKHCLRVQRESAIAGKKRENRCTTTPATLSVQHIRATYSF